MNRRVADNRKISLVGWACWFGCLYDHDDPNLQRGRDKSGRSELRCPVKSHNYSALRLRSYTVEVG